MIKIGFDAHDDWAIGEDAPEYSKEDAPVESAKSFLDKTASYTAGDVDSERINATAILNEYGKEDSDKTALGSETVDVDEAYKLLEMEYDHVSSVENNTEADLEAEVEELGQALESFEEVRDDLASKGLNKKVPGIK